MPIVECQTHAEYVKKLDELRAANRKIAAVYTYWYEGAGSRRLVIPGGHAAKEMFEKLSLDEKLKLTFALRSPEQFPPDIQELARQYRECVKKDYEETGGYTVAEGAPEDAVTVIEYD